MENGLFIITGTSKGIGEALSNKLLSQGNTVFGISRGKSEALTAHKKYFHVFFDLLKLEQIDGTLKKILAQAALSRFEMVCLVNNASLLEPLKPIERANHEEIRKHFTVSLIATSVLTSSFIRNTKDVEVRKKIVNITSGAGERPLQDMSIYCSAKAGINMLTQSVGLEQKGLENPVEIIAVNPHMVETGMQRVARSKDDQEFAMAKMFKSAFEEKKVQTVENIAEVLAKILEKRYESGSLVNSSDPL